MQTFFNKDGQEIHRTPCQVFTRVMGYLRPVSHYNIGKKSEFYSRKYFDEQKTSNSAFVRQFAPQMAFVGCGCENN
ncbi:MAG: anaerobic ribonucleoside-triphosphate reductase [bacterium]